jgi:hypothetical protein
VTGIRVEWECKDCGNVRRVEVTDVVSAVYRFRPARWQANNGGLRCDLCSVRVTTTSPDSSVTTFHQGQHAGVPAGDMRAQLSRPARRWLR